MFKSNKFLCIFFFIISFTSISARSMPLDKLVTTLYSSSKNCWSTNPKRWEDLEIQYNTLINHLLSEKGSYDEERWNRLTNFEDHLDQFMGTINDGLDENTLVGGSWPFYKQVSMFLPTYLLMVKARCLLIKTEHCLEAKDWSDCHEEIHIWMKTSKDLITKSNEFINFFKKENLNEKEKNDRSYYLINLHFKLNKETIILKTDPIKFKKIPYDFDMITTIEGDDYDNEYSELITTIFNKATSSKLTTHLKNGKIKAKKLKQRH